MITEKGLLDKQYSDDRKRKPELKFRLSARAKIVADAAKRYLNTTSELNILDMGSAEGLTMIAMSELLSKSNFVGVEYSRDLINSASILPQNIALLQGDITSLPPQVKNSNFDIVSALAVLEHLKSPLDAVLEAASILKPGGIFVATCPVPLWDLISNKLGLLKEDHHEMKMNKSTMIKIFQNAGLKVVNYRKFMWAPISFLPYLHIPISPLFGSKCDQYISLFKIFNWLFVNQAIVGRKLSM